MTSSTTLHWLPAMVIGLLVVVSRSDPAERGLKALRDGDAEAAYATLSPVVEERGDAASADLLRAFALAAAKSGRPVDATIAIETAATRAGEDFLPTRDFVLGQIAYVQAEAIGRQARQPNADPTTFDQAIGKALTAALRWRELLDEEIPGLQPGAVTRNLERALRLAESLRAAREEVLKNAQKRNDQQQNERQGEPENGEQKKEEIEVDTDPLAGPDRFDDEALHALFEKLAREQSEKRALRNEARDRRSAGVRRDW